MMANKNSLLSVAIALDSYKKSTAKETSKLLHRLERPLCKAAALPCMTSLPAGHNPYLQNSKNSGIFNLLKSRLFQDANTSTPHWPSLSGGHLAQFRGCTTSFWEIRLFSFLTKKQTTEPTWSTTAPRYQITKSTRWPQWPPHGTSSPLSATGCSQYSALPISPLPAPQICALFMVGTVVWPSPATPLLGPGLGTHRELRKRLTNKHTCQQAGRALGVNVLRCEKPFPLCS